MIRIAILLLALLFSQSVWAVTPVVEGFVGDPISLLDEQGKLQRELPLKDAPTQPLPVLQYNEALELVQVDLSGQKVWLDTMDVKLNPSKTVKLPCQTLSTGLKEDAHNSSTLGFGAGCNKP